MQLQHCLSIVSAFLETLVFAGINLGWPFLQFVLEREGYFSYLCRNNSTPDDAVNQTTMRGIPEIIPTTCNESQASFNLVFTLTANILHIAAFLLGFLLDRYGSWIFRSMMTIISTFGLVLLTISSPSWSNLLYPSYICLGVSGIGLFLSNLQTANLIKNYRGSAIAFMSGLLASSSLVFFLIKLGYEAGIDLTLMLAILSSLTLFQWLRTFVLTPKIITPFPLPSDFKFGYKDWKCFKQPNTEHDIPNIYTVEKTLKDVEDVKITESGNQIRKTEVVKSFKSCIKNVLFWTNLFYVGVVTFMINYVVGIAQTWLSGFADPMEVSKLTNDFGFMLFFAAFVATLNGILFDAIVKHLNKTSSNFMIANLTASMISAIVTICLTSLLCIMLITFNPYGAFIFQLFTLSFIFGGNATFISIFFPIEHIGKIYGLTNLAVGLVGLLQYALFQLAAAVDANFFFTNIGLLIVVILTLVHPLFIYLKIKTLKRTECIRNKCKKSKKRFVRCTTDSHFGAELSAT